MFSFFFYLFIHLPRLLKVEGLKFIYILFEFKRTEFFFVTEVIC